MSLEKESAEQIRIRQRRSYMREYMVDYRAKRRRLEAEANGAPASRCNCGVVRATDKDSGR
jgi:hypothetical protein